MPASCLTVGEINPDLAATIIMLLYYSQRVIILSKTKKNMVHLYGFCFFIRAHWCQN